MKYYYYAENNQQFGPYAIDDLKLKRLKKATLIWTEGMDNWAPAETIIELKEILISEPPPLPKKNIATQTATIYTKRDNSYKKEKEATFFGILIIIVETIFLFILKNNIETDFDYLNFLGKYYNYLLIKKIGITIWVINIAKRQYRNKITWGIFSFIFPEFSLIIIGLLNKRRFKIKLNGSLSESEKINLLFYNAKDLFNEKRYSECIELLNNALLIESNDFECIKLRGLAYYNSLNYQNAKSDFELLSSNQMYPEIVNFYLGNIALIQKNRELAITYWVKADELKNEEAREKLYNFHTFTGNYLLNETQIIQKIDNKSKNFLFKITDINYQGSLLQIDTIEKSDAVSTVIVGYNLGLDIELRDKTKKIDLAISYYEIIDIVYKINENVFDLNLIDNNILTFKIDQYHRFKLQLRYLCKIFKDATGITPNALTILENLGTQ